MPRLPKMIGSPRRTPLTSCPSCGKPLDGATGIDVDARPKPGDITICGYCRHLMLFADDLTVRELTDAEAVEVAGDETMLAAQNALAILMKAKGGGDAAAGH